MPIPGNRVDIMRSGAPSPPSLLPKRSADSAAIERPSFLPEKPHPLGQVLAPGGIGYGRSPCHRL